jgi:hypothetical protein
LDSVDEAQLHHSVEGGVPLLDGVVRSAAQVVQRGVADEHRERRTLGQGEVLQLLAEVLPGRGLYPVGAPPEVDRIEIELEDLPLGVAPFQLDAHEHLADLALGGYLVADEDLGHLLGDG